MVEIYTFSDTLLVLAPHQFSKLHKTSSKTSFTTPTENSRCGNLAVASSSLQITNSSNQTNRTVIEDSVTEDNNHKIPHDIESKNERGHFKNQEMTSQLIVPEEYVVAQSQVRKTQSINETESDESIKNTARKRHVENNGSISHYSTSWLMVLLGMLLILLYMIYSHNLERRCTPYGMRMNWDDGPPPT